MSLLAIVLILASAFFSPLRDLCTKQSKDKPLFVWWMAVCAIVITFPFAAYFLFTQPPTLRDFGFIAAVSFVHVAFWFFNAKAYEGGDISHVYPIIRSSPALVLLLAIVFLEEKVSMLGVAGIGLTTLGLYIINLKKISLKGILEPIRSIRTDVHTQWAILALISVGIFYILDKVGVENIHPMNYAILTNIFGWFIYSAYILSTRSKKQILKPWQNNRLNIFWAALFASLNYPLLLFALQISNVSYINAFKQVSVVIAVVFGSVFLKEKSGKIRLFAALLILAGALTIALA